MKKLYIHQAVSLSAQGYWEGFYPVDLKKDLKEFKAIDPDYKSIIPAMALRRMSKITRMALMCGLTISKESEVVWDAIVVGTGLGNLADTEKFLNLISTPDAGLISPTAFTQSSHNTLSGQLALQLSNNGYNMTHVQRGLSFEYALSDALMQSQFGMKNILLGTADEHIPLLDILAGEMGFPDEMITKIGEGASFFQLSSDTPSIYFLEDILIKKNFSNLSEEIDSFLLKNAVDKDSCLFIEMREIELGEGIAQVTVSDYVGNYMSNSGFAMHLACVELQSKEFTHGLLVNADSENGLGLILIGYE